MPLQPGEIVHNRYMIESTIAQGGMGAVYLARDLTLDISVAVKENLGGTDSYARQFRREGTVLAGLVHPNLPRVTDHFVSETGSQYLVMDFISGEDLREMIKRMGPLPEDLVLRVGITICSALNYLHTHQPPILHRDIKPGNIKITPGGEIFLVDFGLVKVVQGSGATTTGAQSLTPGYAPPEQYGGGTDQRSDIYSLGATLYAALTGKIPEDGISRAMGNSRLTPISNHKSAVDPRISAAIERALSIEPEKRFQTAVEFQEVLFSLLPASEQTKELAGIEPTISDQGKVSTPSGQTHKNSPGRIIGVAAAVIIFIALVASAESIVRMMIPSRSTAPTNLPAFINTKTVLVISSPTIPLSPAAPTLNNQVLLPLIETPTTAQVFNATPGEMIAFASDREGVPQVFLLRLSDGTIQKVTSLAQGACQPAWSPKGDRLVVISPCSGVTTPHKKASLYLMNPDGSGLTSLITMPGGDFDPDWSPDGNKIAFTSMRDSTEKMVKYFIYVYDFVNGKSTRILKTTPNQQNPQFSPDGSQIAFEMFPTNDAQIYVMNADGSNPSQVTKLTEGPARFPAWFADGLSLMFTQVAKSGTLWEKGIDGSGSKMKPMLGITQPAKNAAFSPDGMWLIYESDGDIWRMPAAGGTAENLTQSEAKDFDPAWRP
jgi:eukaryotic-like serine/threonine-protein kinase